MSISSYNTLACSAVNTRAVTQWLINGGVAKTQHGEITSIEDSFNQVWKFPKGVVGFYGESLPFMPLQHPLTVTNKGVTVSYIDLRAYVSEKGRFDSALTGRITSMLKILVTRAALEYNATINADTVEAAGLFPLRMFSRWLASLISTNLGLDFNVHTRIAAITAIYFGTLLENSKGPVSYSEMDISQISRVLTKLLGFPDFEDLFAKTNAINTLLDYVEAVKTHGDSVRLENFSVQTLYTIVGGSWIGTNSRETVAVAVESPATFIALLYTALQDKLYSKSQLGDLSIRSSQPAERSAWIKTITSLDIDLTTK